LPFSAVVGNAPTDLEVLGRDRVHWTQARLELLQRYPHLGEKILREAFAAVLESMWPGGDPRISMVFNKDLDFVWGDGLWLDVKNLQPTPMDNDAEAGLPYVLDVVADNEGRLVAITDKVRRAKAKHRHPRGYTPVLPVRGISFSDDSGCIPMPVPPGPKHQIKLLDNPISEAAAFQALQQAFPSLDQTYLKAALGAAICADARGGQPPMLTCTGPSGSGKEQHVRLAASIMGQDILKLSLGDSEEVFARQLGVAVTAGYRFLMFDELGKTRNLSSKMKNFLMIANSVQWRPLYQNRIVTTPVRAAIFFPCVRFPDFLKGSQEFIRRTRHIDLFHKLPNWAHTSGGDTAAWRDRTAENARVANSILTHVWRLAHEVGFRFF
jgi:hypothetical protein